MYLRTFFLMIFLFTCALSTFPLKSTAADIPQPRENKNFPSVEARRLDATIKQERANILEERKGLVLKENELKTLEEAVDKKLAELDKKLEKLRQEKQELADLLAQKDAAQLKKIKELGKIYEKMDPGKAALALTGLDPQLAADLLANMKVKAAAQILNNVNRPKASELSRTFSTIQME